MIYVIELNGKKYRVDVDDKQVTLLETVQEEFDPQQPLADQKIDHLQQEDENHFHIKAPMYGVIMKIEKTKGSSVKKGDLLFILEAMKMENEIVAPENGKIKDILVSPGENVQKNAVLLVIEKR
jgi:glutaconyl-CoA/methylmalonyl-CoA decarboxylase subunit gamma